MYNENGFLAIDTAFVGNDYVEDGIMFSDCDSVWGDDDYDYDNDAY